MSVWFESCSRSSTLNVPHGRGSRDFNERAADSAGCFWNSNVLIGEDGAILNHHRRLVPTF